MDYNIEVQDLVCFGNISLKKNIDTKILEVNSDNLLVKGQFELENFYAVAGTDLIKVTSYSIEKKNTRFSFVRNQFNVKGTFTVGNHFRKVLDPNELECTSWEYTDTMGAITNNLFPVELASGNVVIKSPLDLWSSLSETQIYKVKSKKTIVYIFKGTSKGRELKFTTFASKVKFNTKNKTDLSKITIEIKSKLSLNYTNDLAINQQFKATTPKEFLQTIFQLEDNEIYYADGVVESSFPSLGNLHSKEFKTFSDILKAYCSSVGVRFTFDREEKLKIFGDFNVDNLNSDKVYEYNIISLMLSEDERLIYNTINTESEQRLTMYNFDDLDKKYVKFFKKKENIVNSSELMTVAENGDYQAKSVSIQDKDLFESVQIKDYVLFKRKEEPMLEIYGRVMSLEKNNTVVIMPILYDKDYKLLYYGKSKYLYNILVGRSGNMDLYFVKEELPITWKLTRKKGNDEVDSSLMMPLLPRVNGESKYREEITAIFGSASDLKLGQYTGIVEESHQLYGTWDSSKLLYNRELTQFDNTVYPPIFALSNRVNERTIEGNKYLIDFTSYDNNNLLIEVEKPKNGKEGDATLYIQNTLTVNSDIDLYEDKEVKRLGNKILIVKDITPYKIGDVLILKKPDDLTPQEDREYEEVLKNIRWVIKAKESERLSDGTDVHRIYLDSPFAKRQKPGQVYEFIRFPNTSIVYLQELYFRGNPLISYTQTITGLAKGSTSTEGETSNELYGEQKYELDGKLLDKENLKKMMGYILHNFHAVNKDSTKFEAPISLLSTDLNLLDLIKLRDTEYTKITEKMLWVVTSVSYKMNTNVATLKVLNVNTKNTEPYKIDIKDMIEYKPVDIPKYDHAGGEGNNKPNPDGGGGTDVDKDLGQFWLAEVDPQVFRARVDKVEGNYIYFKDFNGTEVDKYKSKLFPTSEFAVNINGELIFVRSDLEYRAYIKKRRVYGTEEALITPEDEVRFFVTTTFVDIDGTFYSRKAMLGDGDSYLKVDPITGVKVVGDFVVGENNKNPNNDLWQSLQNNRTFQQDDKPVNTPAYMIKEGDIWIDTNDQNHPYRFNGKVWISTRDGSIVSTQNSVFIQPNEPQDKDGRPLVEGDTWYDTDDGYKPYVWKDGRWNNVTDKGLEAIIQEVKKQAEDSTKKISDMANDNKLTPDEKKQISLEIEQIKTEYPKYMTESEKFGLSNTVYKEKYDRLTKYVEPLLAEETTSDILRPVFMSYFTEYYEARQNIINAISSKAKELADKAQADATTALGNAKIFWATEKPTEGMKENDLWYDTDDQNHPYIYRGAEKGWVSARDMVYETDGGNKVFFKDTMPDINYKGAKQGDMWFDTAHSNTQYVLMLQDNGQLKWTLASDALDKINTGRIVLNGNTQVNGDFIVRGKNIELTGDTKVNGILEVFSNDKGIISYNGTTESNSTKRIIIRGGEIVFQERVL